MFNDVTTQHFKSTCRQAYVSMSHGRPPGATCPGLWAEFGCPGESRPTPLASLMDGAADTPETIAEITDTLIAGDQYRRLTAA